MLPIKFGCYCFLPGGPGHFAQHNFLNHSIFTKVWAHYRHSAYVVVEIRQERPEDYEKPDDLSDGAKNSPSEYNHEESTEINEWTLDFAFLSEKFEYAWHPDKKVEA